MCKYLIKNKHAHTTTKYWNQQQQRNPTTYLRYKRSSESSTVLLPKKKKPNKKTYHEITKHCRTIKYFGLLVLGLKEFARWSCHEGRFPSFLWHGPWGNQKFISQGVKEEQPICKIQGGAGILFILTCVWYRTSASHTQAWGYRDPHWLQPWSNSLLLLPSREVLGEDRCGTRTGMQSPADE